MPADRTAGTARGATGAAATGHPLATGAALEVLALGGTAVDAAVAAHAVLAVVLPGACGLGGDALALVRTPGGVTAVNGTGATAAAPRPPAAALNGMSATAAAAPRPPAAAVDGTSATAAPRPPAADSATSGTAGAPARVADGGASVTVPGAVGAWFRLLDRHGRLPAATVLAPAVRVARDGFAVSAALVAQVARQRPRLERGGAASWALLSARPGEVVVQPELAAVLERLAADGPRAYYTGALAGAICRAVVRDGGCLAPADLAAHTTAEGPPVSVAWGGDVVHVQPPVSQGVLLAMALRWLDRHPGLTGDDLEHAGVELTEAVFAHRDRCARDGAALLGEDLDVDLERAAGRGGPLPYLHTTGVAVADAQGTVVSSLLTLFDDFGAGTFVPEGGFVLTNRAAGFTAAPNDPRPAARPVHTLAPALVASPQRVTALATPGADGQVQTLLQVLTRMRYGGLALPDAVAAPRWRSVAARLHVEAAYGAAEPLRRRGHDVVVTGDGDDLFGAVVSATWSTGGTSAVGDWRREVAVGGV